MAVTIVAKLSSAKIIALGSEGVDDPQLVLGSRPGEDPDTCRTMFIALRACERRGKVHSGRLVRAILGQEDEVPVLTPCSRNRRNWTTPDVTPATGRG
jgi:hypothetical protein